MTGVQIEFAFRRKIQRRPKSGFDLVGHSYAEDDRVKVTVIGLCRNSDHRVLLRRRPGGTFSMPVWLVSAILLEEQKQMKRAA